MNITLQRPFSRNKLSGSHNGKYSIMSTVFQDMTLYTLVNNYLSFKLHGITSWNTTVLPFKRYSVYLLGCKKGDFRVHAVTASRCNRSTAELIVNLTTRWKQVTSCFSHFTPSIHCMGGWVCPGWSRCFGEKVHCLHLTEFKSQTVWSVA